MEEGSTNTIEFIGWNDLPYRAKLETIKWRIEPTILTGQVRDPDWFIEPIDHTAESSYRSEGIGFVGAAGLPEKWWSKCHSSSDNITKNISFHFENYLPGQDHNDDGDHQSNKLNVLGADRRKWEITIPDFFLDNNDEKQPMFQVKSLE
jgi:hypothetical protein